MARKPTGWNPATHTLVNGKNWRIGRSRGALVALRGRNGRRVEEIRLVDRTKSRNLDWASNTVVVRFDGTLETAEESQRVYELCRAWWQRHSQINDLGVRAFFQVSTRQDGAYQISLHLRSKLAQHAELPKLPLVILRISDQRWEWFGIRLLDAAARLLNGDPTVDGEINAISVDALITRS